MSWGAIDGKEVKLYTIKSNLLEVDISPYGAALVAVRVRHNGEWIDVLLGYETLARYTDGGKPNFGTAVGRCANRIAGGRFDLDGSSFHLDKNNGPNHLHGGREGFYQKLFQVEIAGDAELVLCTTELDGAMGYPGTVNVKVVYLVSGGDLHFRYSGETDKPTLLSMTNHGYWNLKGHGCGTILDHHLQVEGSRTTLVDGDLAITGELAPVEGTSLDLRGSPRLLQDVVDSTGPVDCNYCLDVPSEGTGAETQAMMAARLVGPNGLCMEVWTDQPGLQVFTGHNIGPENPAWWHGKGATWEKFGAVCLEPQLWPDGVHHSHFPSPVLRPGQVYSHHSWHVFSKASSL